MMRECEEHGYFRDEYCPVCGEEGKFIMNDYELEKLGRTMAGILRHGRFDLTLTCKGDTYVDDHHSVEDIGIVLGKAFAEALGEKRGIRRYGDIILPMDEALILSAADLSGRGYLAYDLKIPAEKVGTFDTELVEEFFRAFTVNGGITLHIKQLAGYNSHHIIEGAFKSVARSLREAVSSDGADPDEIPSTKGVL